MNSESQKRKVSDNIKIVIRLVKNNHNDKYFYPREAKIAKKLIQQFGLEFMLWLPLPYDSQVVSLAWFLNKEGGNFLRGCLYDYKLNNPENKEYAQIELLPEKIGKDVMITKEPKTLIEFLNKYK